jgi:hypothetical protein
MEAVSHLKQVKSEFNRPEEFPMKMLFGVGLVVLILGIVSFFVPYPQKENHGIKVGDASIGVQTEHSEKVPVVVSAILLLGGAGMMIAGRGRG